MRVLLIIFCNFFQNFGFYRNDIGPQGDTSSYRTIYLSGLNNKNECTEYITFDVFK